MTMKERIESALHTAVSETKSAIRELAAATKRGDDEAVAHWQAATNYWVNKIEERIKGGERLKAGPGHLASASSARGSFFHFSHAAVRNTLPVVL